jgi:hypothetical protein
MPWFVKIERGIVDKTTFDRHVPAHKAYVRSLIERGHQAKTGYWGDFGGGMLLFYADSLDQAKELIAQDPLIKMQCVEFELHEWRVIVE